MAIKKLSFSKKTFFILVILLMTVGITIYLGFLQYRSYQASEDVKLREELSKQSIVRNFTVFEPKKEDGTLTIQNLRFTVPQKWTYESRINSYLNTQFYRLRPSQSFNRDTVLILVRSENEPVVNTSELRKWLENLKQEQIIIDNQRATSYLGTVKDYENIYFSSYVIGDEVRHIEFNSKGFTYFIKALTYDAKNNVSYKEEIENLLDSIKIVPDEESDMLQDDFVVIDFKTCNSETIELPTTHGVATITIKPDEFVGSCRISYMPSDKNMPAITDCAIPQSWQKMIYRRTEFGIDTNTNEGMTSDLTDFCGYFEGKVLPGPKIKR